MVTKRVRSEYMKKFKDPKWETYAKCYEDLVKYRLSRRLLEQAHNPWFWDERGSDTDSSGKSTPLCRNKVEPLQLVDETPPGPTSTKETAGQVDSGPNETQNERDIAQADTSPPVEQDTRDGEHHGKHEGRSGEFSSAVQRETDTCAQTTAKSKPHNSHKTSRSTAKHKITKDTDKESRHPFAMYGAGERSVEMASRKTHNVGPAASTKEIHESALRAKTRREVEKQMKRVDKRRAKSADLEKMNRSKITPDYNPWMTEYMRCFSARSR
ncbi:centriole, cilia and spindle-associated protein [Brachyhypopomus gauderio]|uniref:centriole, cilia and spindle-associated protein n=1 Tax=Brachyhypopomus gauderio TaxID=698409 RepID=UPI004042ADEF